jgi:hypothetical protein
MDAPAVTAVGSPFPVDPADIDDEVWRPVWRTMTIRQGYPADEDDARLIAAMVIAALAIEPRKPVFPPSMTVSGQARAARQAAYPSAYPTVRPAIQPSP